jgi:hypothetical protein
VSGPRSRRPRTSPSAIPDATADLIIWLRKELAGQGLDAGPHTIAWHLEHHHQVTVSAATISRYLSRAGLVTPEPRKRPRSSYIRFAAEQPSECWQSGFTRYPLPGGGATEILTWLDDHSRYALRVTAHHHVTARLSWTSSAPPSPRTAPRPPPSPTTGWSSPPGWPAARAAATPWKPSCAASASPRRTATRTTPRPRGKPGDSSRPSRNGSPPSPPSPRPSLSSRTSQTPSPTPATPGGRTGRWSTAPPPPPPTPPGPGPPPATAPATPTTASAASASTATAPSPCASPAACAISASAAPTPAPTSCCSSRTCTSASSTPPPASSSASSPSTPAGTASPPAAHQAPRRKHPDPPRVQGVLDVVRHHSGVSDGIRTHDIQDHNLAL